jgi:AAA domain/Primase C terminal 2 (PriCT-2)
MDNEVKACAVTFLRHILPAEGLRIGAVMTDHGMRQRVLDTNEQLAQFLLEADAKGQDAYHACATFRDRKGVYNERKGKCEVRCQANVLGVSCFWADIDTREGKPDAPYADRQEACGAVVVFCKASGMPPPLFLSSGYGVHIYWPLCEPLSAAAWPAYAKRLARLFETHGLKVDRSRTQDSASILRPPGTHNRKSGGCLAVQCGELVGPYRIEDLPLGGAIEAMPSADRAAQATRPSRSHASVSECILGAQEPPPWSQVEEVLLRSALVRIPPVERQIWLLVGMALHWTRWPRAFEIWDEWSRTVLNTHPQKYNGQDQYRTWESFGRHQGDRVVTIATIYHLAKQHGWHGTAGTAPVAGETASLGSNQIAGGKTTRVDGLVTAADLRSMTFPPVRFVLPGFVPEGVTLLVGRPKIGKSFLALDLCLASAADCTIFGTIKPLHGDVLYLALEDSMRRLQRRIDKLMLTFNGEWPTRLSLVPSGGWPRTDQGGLDKIEAWCKSTPKPVLVVVDTLERIRKPANGKTSLYSADYEAIAGLQKIAIEHGIAIVVLHHDRKSEAEDAFDTVSGTLGLTGAADTILIIKRKPNGVVLHARGRDIEESETAMLFDKETCRWTILGAASEVHRSSERARVIAALREARHPLSVREIMIEAEMRNRTATDTLLSKMVKAGEIERAAKGRYCLPAEKPGKIGQMERSSGQVAAIIQKTN